MGNAFAVTLLRYALLIYISLFVCYICDVCYVMLSSFIYLYLFFLWRSDFCDAVTLCSPPLYISLCACYVCDAVTFHALLLYISLFVFLWRGDLCDAVHSLMFGQHIGLHCDHGLLPMSHSLYFGLQINDTFCNYSENQSHTLCVLWFIYMYKGTNCWQNHINMTKNKTLQKGRTVHFLQG